jgi:hypothetical protein
VNQIDKNDERKLLHDEKMTNIFRNIPLLHSLECPVQILGSSLRNSSLELITSELSKASNVKVASVAIIQDRQVDFTKCRTTFFLLKETRI